MDNNGGDVGYSPDRRRVLRFNLSAAVILALGCLQMVGFVLGNRVLRGVGAASGASPLPKVFSAINGYETFAADFTILYELADQDVELAVLPELYQRLGGPYNRRNVYGAALSYAPVLPEKIWQAVFRYSLKSSGPFIAELGIPADASRVRIRVRAKTRGSGEEWILDPGHSE